jgi:Heterokaryon incompatibility protein (HET)
MESDTEPKMGSLSPVLTELSVKTPLVAPKLYMETKNHGLHNLPLCESCRKISFDELISSEPVTLFDNCFSLLRAVNACRLCAYIGQTIMAFQSTTDLEYALRMFDLERPVPLSVLMNLKEEPLRKPVQLSIIMKPKEKQPHIEQDFDQTRQVCYILFHIPLDRKEKDVSINSFKKTWASFILCRSKVLAPQRNHLSCTSLQNSTGLAATPQYTVPKCCKANYWRNQTIVSSITRASKQSSRIPFRVLDISGYSSGEGSSIQLVTGSSMVQGYYSTLSHRWGEQQIPLRTTKDSIEHHMSRISFSSLPRSFQDAVIVTSELGLRYLWIDALCIIQDDEDDWKTQASRMLDIYSNSLVTIAAHSAQNSSEGFLWRREISNILQVPLGSTEGFQRDSVNIKISGLSDGAITNAFANSHICSRAWVFQELSISKKILHFVEDRIFWECSHSASAGKGIHRLTLTLAYLFRNSITKKGTWHDIVERYTECSLTNPSDKLIAMQGIADAWRRQAFHEGKKPPPRYLSGIFEQDVLASLTWHRRSDDHSLIRQECRAPGWSWASVDGQIQFMRYPRNDSIKINADALVISCNSEEIVLSALILKTCSFGQGVKRKRFTLKPGCRYVQTLVKDSSQIGRFNAQSNTYGWAVLDNGDDAGTLHFLRLSNVWNKNIAQCIGLLATPWENRPGTYLRRGIACIYRLEVFEGIENERIMLI